MRYKFHKPFNFHCNTCKLKINLLESKSVITLGYSGNKHFVCFQFAVKKLGGIDILVLNHFYLQIGKWLGTPENITDLYNLMDLNFYAYALTATHALASLKARKGSIIVMSSHSGTFPLKDIITSPRRTQIDDLDLTFRFNSSETLEEVLDLRTIYCF